MAGLPCQGRRVNVSPQLLKCQRNLRRRQSDCPPLTNCIKVAFMKQENEDPTQLTDGEIYAMGFAIFMLGVVIGTLVTLLIMT